MDVCIPAYQQPSTIYTQLHIMTWLCLLPFPIWAGSGLMTLFFMNNLCHYPQISVTIFWVLMSKLPIIYEIATNFSNFLKNLLKYKLRRSEWCLCVAQEVVQYRSTLGMLYCYDWISIPLVYTQVSNPTSLPAFLIHRIWDSWDCQDTLFTWKAFVIQKLKKKQKHLFKIHLKLTL